VPAIREATGAGLDAIAELHRLAWDVTNAPHFPDRVIASNTFERRLGTWRWLLARLDTNVLVAETESRVVGAAATGPARDADLNHDTVGEVYGLYLRPDAWERGHGKALHEAAIAGLCTDGYLDAVLSVLAINRRARRFYEQRGWSLDGAEKRNPAHGVHKLRYRLALAEREGTGSSR
jgi:GNAT superfamily N-acetyltransferase